MKRTKSSAQWLKDHFSDPYVILAQKAGYRSRAVYKLKEVNEKEKLLKPGMNIVDLGAAPGGWSQYVAEQLKGKGEIYALDCLPMDPYPGVQVILGDFTQAEVLKRLMVQIPTQKVDILLSDMAPNMSGNAAIDMPRVYHLAELVLECADEILKKSGILFMKLFHGQGFEDFVKQVRQQFHKVSIRKPKASRPHSRETYLLATGYHL